MTREAGTKSEPHSELKDILPDHSYLRFALLIHALDTRRRRVEDEGDRHVHVT
jgi:hypothetical protein